ncbi:MAG TPA: hypothetical protein VM598_13835 [Bdellovibrionota bacterium]|nr:hypothetical protein [Bdellovibrionota bacterium]
MKLFRNAHPGAERIGQGGEVEIHQHRESTETPLRILARHALMDVVRYELPEELRARCDSLEPVKQRSFLEHLAEMASYVTIGYVDGRPTSNFSDELPWSGGFSFSDIDSHPRGPGRGESFYEITELRMLPGMSSGPTFTHKGELLGINSELVISQQRAFVVPLSFIWDFVHGHVAPEQPSAGWEQKFAPEPGRNGQRPGAGGNNGHAGGGEGNNGHAGGGQGAGGRAAPSALAIFREPDEGRPLPGSPGLILLGVRDRQIDGTNDYAIHFAPHAERLSAKDLVLRPADGFPEEKIRKKLLERLDGFFGPPYVQANGTRGMQKNRHFMYSRLPTSSESWLPGMVGSSLVHLDVDSRKRRITFYLWQHDLSAQGAPGLVQSRNCELALQLGIALVGCSEGSRFLSFIVDQSPDGREIRLVHPKLTLTCENRHYLKLICTGQGTELSLSADRARGPAELSYRATWAFGNGIRPPGIHYFFGKLREEDDQGTRRKHADEQRKAIERVP